MSNYLRSFIAVLLTTMLVTGCSTTPLAPQLQGEVYTQINMWSEKNRSIATNYARGQLVPVNTKVVIVENSSKEIVFKVLSTDQVISIVNVEKYTGLDITGISKRYFSRSQVNLSSYPQKIRSAIDKGAVIKGMTKEAVLIARGYPPAHHTSSLKIDTWKYWQNKFITRNVIFVDNKVIRSEGWGASR